MEKSGYLPGLLYIQLEDNIGGVSGGQCLQVFLSAYRLGFERTESVPQDWIQLFSLVEGGVRNRGYYRNSYR